MVEMSKEDIKTDTGKELRGGKKKACAIPIAESRSN